MTSPHSRPDSERPVARIPARAPQAQDDRDRTAPAPIDATEFWRRLGL